MGWSPCSRQCWGRATARQASLHASSLLRFRLSAVATALGPPASHVGTSQVRGWSRKAGLCARMVASAEPVPRASVSSLNSAFWSKSMRATGTCLVVPPCLAAGSPGPPSGMDPPMPQRLPPLLLPSFESPECKPCPGEEQALQAAFGLPARGAPCACVSCCLAACHCCCETEGGPCPRSRLLKREDVTPPLGESPYQPWRAKK